MRQLWLALFTVPVFFLSMAVFAGEAEKVGFVKGTITIGGKPTLDAVVSVEGISAVQTSAQPKRAMMDQKDMKFIPRVLGLLVGSRVDFPNNDKTFHNVFSTSEAKKFDLGLYPPGKSRSVVFDQPGVVKILCNVHPNMEAYVVVKNHPYYAASDARGNYRLNPVPLGKYRMEVWHPEFGTRAMPFELVREGEVLGMDVDLKKK